MLDPNLREVAPATPSETSYHRSKIFHAELGTNPLLQIAAPLFSLAKYLKDANEPEDVPLLLQNLIHEIRAFEDKARGYDYNSVTISAARYALCAFLDDLIFRNNWARVNNWQQDNLVDYFYAKENEDQRFFLLTEQALHDAKEMQNSLDFLELIYVILSLGFSGEQQKVDNKQARLEKLHMLVYDAIRSQRGEFSRSLIITASDDKALSKKIVPRKEGRSFSMRWLWIGCMVVLLGGLYISLNLHLHHVVKSEKVYPQMQNG